MTAPQLLTEDALDRARQDVLGELDLSCDCAEDEDLSEGEHVDGCFQGAAEAGFNALCADHDRARRIAQEQAAESERPTTPAPQFLVSIAQRLGMGKVTQEQLAAFAREVAADQTEQVRILREEVERYQSEKDSMTEAHVRVTDENEGLRATITQLHEEASANLQRAENAEVRLQQATADNAALVVAGVETCDLCLGKGRYLPYCSFCDDSTHDHECPDWKDCEHPHLSDVFKQPHPGTALLEQHRKEVVRARNEGLEKAKDAVRAALTTGLLTPGNVEQALRAIDALKEAK